MSGFDAWYSEHGTRNRDADLIAYEAGESAGKKKLGLIYERCLKALYGGNEDVMALTDILNIIEPGLEE